MSTLQCLNPRITGKMIEEATKRAMARAKDFKPYKPKKPIELCVEYYDVDHAERISKRVGVKYEGGRTVSCHDDNMLELYNTLML